MMNSGFVQGPPLPSAAPPPGSQHPGMGIGQAPQLPMGGAAGQPPPQQQQQQAPAMSVPPPGAGMMVHGPSPVPGQQGTSLTGGGGLATTSPSVRPSGPPHPPQAPPNAFPAMRPYGIPPMMPNFMSAPPVPMTQMMPPGGMPPRYSAPPFHSMARPTSFIPRPPLGPPPVTMSAVSLPRPLGNGLRLVPPVLKPPPGMSLTELAAKGVGMLASAPEKPHTTVYVGKIAPTIEDDFLRSLLELCGEIKSWKRAQDPTTGSPKGFGFCEFESAEGVLRALRILNKYSLEGQDLVLNVNQATREYLERYVAKKKEREKFLQQQAAEMVKDEELAPGVDSIEAPKPSPLFSKDEGAEKDPTTIEEDGKKFGLVSAADNEADAAASRKLSSMLEERSRLRPLPPPPPLPVTVDGVNKSVTSTLDSATKSRDGDLSADGAKSDDRSTKNDDDTTSDHKGSGDNERNEMTSSDKGGRRSERDRERDREREIEREKERELERFERERERERQRRDRERDMRLREAERLYEEREREWEAREREKERQRLHDREREKEREKDRRKEIKEQEESDDEDWKKPRYRTSVVDEKRKRRLREQEEDSADREREEHESLMKRQKIETSSGDKDGSDDDMDVAADEVLSKRLSPQGPPTKDSISNTSTSDAEDELQQKEVLSSNGVHNTLRHAESIGTVVNNDPELKASSAPRKLGFGIMGSGRRATGLSVFHQEDEEDKTDDRKLRPLVPIDYSAEEMEAVATPNNARAASPQVAPNLAAAAEFARSLSKTSFKEDRKEEGDREHSRRKRDRHEDRDVPRKEKNRDRDRDRERDREREERDRERDREREKEREKKDLDKEREKDHITEKIKVYEPKKILNAKQLIDTIPKTKEELFAFPVDWNIYDKHDLHERMRPWISKKITEFLGEEETTLVDFVVSNTCKHVTAASMLELLEGIVDDEAEMFVLKMWRMLIFEIRRVETGLASSKTKS